MSDRADSMDKAARIVRGGLVVLSLTIGASAAALGYVISGTPSNDPQPQYQSRYVPMGNGYLALDTITGVVYSFNPRGSVPYDWRMVARSIHEMPEPPLSLQVSEPPTTGFIKLPPVPGFEDAQSAPLKKD